MLPDNVSLEEGAMCEPLSVGVHACRRAGIGPGTRILILGAGPIGLVTMLAARAFGAPTILIADVDDRRLSFAKSLGADQTIQVTPSIQDVEKEVEQIHQKSGGVVDVSFDCVGFNKTMATALQATSSGGKVCLIGLGQTEMTVPITAASCLREVEQVFQGCCLNPPFRIVESPQQKVVSMPRNIFAVCHPNFADTTASSFFPNTLFTNHESLPSLQESFVQFIKAYPQYSETCQIDKIRAQEYHDLSHVCLDYNGIGLFSDSQLQSQLASSSSPSPQSFNFPVFDVSFKAVNLKSQLLHGGQGSDLESAIKQRIMDYLKISQNEYCMVFTANRSSAFKLLAESYPFGSSRKLLTVYDC